MNPRMLPSWLLYAAALPVQCSLWWNLRGAGMPVFRCWIALRIFAHARFVATLFERTSPWRAAFTGWLGVLMGAADVLMALDALRLATWGMFAGRRAVALWSAAIAGTALLVGVLAGGYAYPGFPVASARWITYRHVGCAALTGSCWLYLALLPDAPQIPKLRRHCGWAALWFAASAAGDAVVTREWWFWANRGVAVGRLVAYVGWWRMHR